jgi:hypothetical protein
MCGKGDKLISRGGLVVGLLVLFTGCSGSTPPSDGGRQQIGQLQLYSMEYGNANRNVAPADLNSFKNFLTNKKVSDLDKALTSPRGNKPYVIKYGLKLNDSNEGGNLPPMD